jgi:hypothetical protein
VDKVALTRQALAYWMKTLIGDAIISEGGESVPAGLVSEPARNSVCVTHLEALISPALHGAARPTSAQLFQKCQQLNKALREETLRQMILWQTLKRSAAELGVQVTDAEVKRQWEAARPVIFPHSGELETFLQKRGWDLSVELLRVRVNLLDKKINEQLAKKLGTSKQALLAYLLRQEEQWAAKTKCEPGYVTEGCKEFTSAQKDTGASSGVVAEEIVALKRGTR